MPKQKPNAKVSKPNSKPKKKREFNIRFDFKGQAIITGRTAFNTEAKKIPVNQNSALGPTEDRRHILHYDEVLKPNIERVLTSLYKFSNGAELKILNHLIDAMKKKGLKRLPKTLQKTMERLVTELNSATNNLIPDRADTNKAIEVVRGYVRKCIQELSTQQFAKDCYKTNNTRMAEYKKRAKAIFIINNSGGDIAEERNRIHREILTFIDGCDAPVQLWAVLHDLVYSVTFDFSPKITRDATMKAVEWQKKMQLNSESDSLEQLQELLSLLD